MDTATWRARTESDLKGRPLDRLVYRPEPDVACGPLCSEAPPSSRGLTRAPGWSVVQSVSGSPDSAAHAVRDAVAGGIDAVRIDCSTLRDARDLATVVRGVDFSRTGIRFNGAGPGGVAGWFGLRRGLGLEDDTCKAHFGLDPLGALASRGGLMGSLEDRMRAAALTGAWVSERAPTAKTYTVDSAVWHDAGADEAWTIALGVATAIAYVRAMEAVDTPTDAAFSQIALRRPLGARFLLGVASLRATRRIWSRVAELASVSARLYQTGLPARRERTKRDPTVNLLRHSAAAFAAAVGGAEAVDLPPHVDSDADAVRLARNTQLVLRDEAHLARISDPGGGAHAIEALTDQLARAAWKRLQLIERQGGMASAVTSGFANDQVRACRDRLEHRVRTRRHPIVGVSRFPDLSEAPSAIELLEEAPTVTPGGLDRVEDFASLLPEALRSPFSSLTQALTGPGLCRAPRSTAIQLSEPFESFRARADRSSERPEVYIATLGDAPSHGARAQFGVELANAGGLLAHIGPAADFDPTRTRVVVLAASDADLAASGPDAARALLQAGAAIWCLGRPGENESELREAGVRDFAFIGTDVILILQSIWAEVAR